ncbi:hypothetical protein HZC09_02500 [Candidatus Micrarchaeota archaeon]|nr:hypothetical protein [Candidatus Micrarchaeota archaeon]
MVFDVLSALGALGVLFIPGIFASFALLNGTKYSGFDKLVFGLILGLILVPLLSFTEYFLFSVKFNALLVLANSLLVLLVSFGIMHYQKQRLGFSFKFENKEWKRYAVLGLLTLFIVLTFYLRFSTAWSANFFEFDPFYYEKLTQRLVTDGFVSTWTGDSFYPHQAFQHWPPMVQYLTGSWFALHQLFSGQMFDKDTLILVSQLYPPIVAAMMCFLMFALIREEYNHYLALIPAALFAITPQLVTKLAAGVAEQQPWGLFTALLLLTLLVMALKQRSYRIALFAGLASLVSILGSQQYLWPAMVLAAFIGVQAILDYLSGSFEKKKTLVLLAVSAGFVLGNVIMALYQEQAYFRFDTPHVMFLASSFVFYALLHGISKQLKLQKFLHRLGALAVLFGLVAVGSLFTSLDDIILTTITSQAQIAVAGGALTKTIQEEAATNAGIFPSAFGVINPNLMILLATMLAVFTTAAFLASKKRFKSAAIVLGVSVVGIAFNPLVDAVLNALSSVVAYPPLQALFALVTASDVFTYMLITLAAASIIYLAKEEKNETPLLLVFIFFPIAFVGLSKVKYLVHLSLAIVIVFGYVLGQSLRVLEYFNDWLKFFSNPAHLRAGVIGILLFVGALTVTVQAQTIPNSLAQLEMTRIP